MAGNAPELRIVGSINKEATRKSIQADLDKISKSLTLKIGVGQDGKTDIGKSMKTQAESVKKSYKMMGDANAEFSIKLAKSLEKREALQRKLMVSQDKYITKVKNDTEKEIALKEKLTAKINELQTQTNRNASALGKYKLNSEEKSSLSGYVSDMKNLGDVTGKTSKELQSMVTKAHTATKGIRDLGTEVKASGRTALKFSEYIKNAFVGFSTWSIVTVSWYAMVNMLKDGVKAVYELDTALLELRKVTDLTGSSMDLFIERASNVGDGLARTTREVVSATAEFAKMGYTVSESLNLAKDALMLTNISDGVAEIEDSTSTIITVLKGYGMAASESTRIIDSLNEVSNKYAVSTSDLSSAVQRISSVMKVSGTTFEESLGLFTAMNEVMQDAPRAANSLKTITMRLRGLSEEGETLESGFTAKLEDAYQRVAGVSIMMNGELRSTYDIVTELGTKWGGLTDTQKTYIAQLSAGVWQAQGFASLMENIDVAVGATTDALNSEGSALKENEKRMDSVKGKLSALTGEFQNMWTNALNSELVKVVLDLGIAIVSTIDSIGLFTTAMIALGVVFIKFGGIQTLTVAGMYALDLITGKTTLSAIAATGAFGALGAVMNTLPLIAIVTALGMIVSGIGKAISETKRYNEVLKENKDRLNDILGTAQEQEISETIDRIKEAQKAVESYQEAIKSGSFRMSGGADSNIDEEYKEALNILAEYGLEVKDVADAVSKLESKKKSLIGTIKEEQVAHRSMAQILDDEKSVIDGLEQSANDLQSTVEKLNEGQKINGLELLKLIDNYPQLIKYIDKNNNLVITKEQLEKELWDTEKEIAVDRLESYRDEMLAKKANFDATVIYYEKYLQMAESMAFVESGLSEAMLNDARNALLSAKRGIIEANKELGIVETKIKVVSGSSLSDFYSKDSKASDKKDILSGFKAQQNAVSDLSYELGILSKQIELAEGEQKIALQEKSLLLYEKQQDAVHEYSNALRALIAKGGLSKEDLETLNNQLRENGSEWWEIETAVKSLSDTMTNDLKQAMEETLKAQEELAKEASDIFKDLADALEKQDEQRTEDAKNQIKKRISDVEGELDALERAYQKASDKIEEDDINEKIAKLTAERLMRSVEGSLDANARIYEIDKELADLNGELSEHQRKVEYETQKQILEDKKTSFEKEIEAEENSLAERQRNQVYYAQAKVMLEGKAMNDILTLLQTYNEAYAMDGAVKGDAWATAFLSKLQVVSNFINGIAGGTGGSSSISANQQSYLQNLSATGTAGQQSWAKAELEKAGVTSTKSNQQRYLENMVATGTSGQKSWASAQLKAGIYHDGIENGLVGGVPMPKHNEQLALLAKGEGVFNQSQMNNLSSAINGINPKTGGSVGSSIRIDQLIGNISANLSSNQDIIATSKLLAKSTETELRKLGVRL